MTPDQLMDFDFVQKEALKRAHQMRERMLVLEEGDPGSSLIEMIAVTAWAKSLYLRLKADGDPVLPEVYFDAVDAVRTAYERDLKNERSPVDRDEPAS